MPRYSNIQLYQVNIADGFASDCDELVHRCLQVPTLDFQEFSKIWKAMNFDLLYLGRTSSAEIAELSEELVNTAKRYMVKDTSYFQESVAGLFLVYSLLHLQPFSGFAYLTLVPADVRAVTRIEMVARRERRLDILYILGEVLVKWTQYHVVERPRGMEMVIRKYLEGFTFSLDKRGVRPMGVFYRQNEELDHIRDLGSVTRQYLLAKKALVGDAASMPSLQYINSNLAVDLNASLRKLVSGVAEDSEPEVINDSSSENEMNGTEDRSNRVQAIKDRAMKNSVGPMNHLTCVDDRNKIITSPKKKDLKRPTGKIKTDNHTKPVTTSPKKKKVKPRNILSRKRILKGNFVNSSGSSDNSDNDDDLDIDEFHKEDETTEREIEPQTENQDIEVNPTNLPLILKPGDLGNDIEIEIIDYSDLKTKTDETANSKSDDTAKSKSDKTVKSKSNNTAKSKTGVAAKSKTNGTAKSKTVKKTKTKTKTKTNTYESSSTDDESLVISAARIVHKTYRKRQRKDEKSEEKLLPVRKKEKRELVRRDMKSKFRRMGMLPVANFENEK
ncbi:uncharacterized protein LOC112050253 [Bicyclus anynana]|uniref:Uncharacterized protein LOC112050253 n=1 Tax=Bicyclus anynana TaxID=110368 RepID=A0A6J1NH02_BICAN|nr:uncharacterized protein LOC112050253 [Bicyclus anynana]